MTHESQVDDLFEEILIACENGREAQLLDGRTETEKVRIRARLELLGKLDVLASALNQVDQEEQGFEELEADLSTLGRFSNLALLGEGGLSRVHAADDTALSRRVALKTLKIKAQRSADSQRWLTSEGRSLAHLDHPAVVRVYDVGEVDDTAFIVMELVAGSSLAQVMTTMRAKEASEPLDKFEAGTLDLAEGLESTGARCLLVARIARALQYCHTEGVIHRDVKPANVLLTPIGFPKVVDFGISHLDVEGEGEESLHTQTLVGTPAYLAPEQVAEGRTGANAASDQFALGVLLYELLTLSHPFARSTRPATLSSVSRAEPIPIGRKRSSLPLDVQLICAHAMERAPHDRYASIGDLADDLEAFLDHRAISLRPPTPWRMMRDWVRSHPRVLAVSLALGAMALSLMAWRLTTDYLSASRDTAAILDWNDARTEELARATSASALTELLEALPRGRDLIAGAARSPFVGPEPQNLEDRWEALRQSAVDRVFKLWLEEHEPNRSVSSEMARQARLKQASDTWSNALYAARQLPKCPQKRRGHIDLPHEGTLYRNSEKLDLALGSRRFKKVDDWVDRPLLDGLYRFTTGVGPAFRELELFIYRDEPVWKPELRAFTADETLEMTSHTGTPGSLAMRASTPSTAPFEISTELVTWAQVAGGRFAGSVEFWRNESAHPEANMPAVLPWGLAFRCAQEMGARLPTITEAVLGCEGGLTYPAGFECECVVGPIQGLDRLFLSPSTYLDRHATNPPHPEDGFELKSDSDKNQGGGFRIARSLPDERGPK